MSLEDELADVARRAREAGLSSADLAGLVQAYARAIGRIVAAETNVTARAMAHVPAEERAAWAAAWVDRLAPLSDLSFRLRHRHELERAVIALLGVEGDPRVGDLAVAFVDLRGSTAFMASSTAGEIRALVDGIFLAAQEVTQHHDVTVTKHLGDGILLVGRDRADTLDAVLEAIERLGHRTPLRAAAGVDFGAVTTRAGDHFGPPVNVASRLAEVAPPDGALVAARAVPEDAPPGVATEVLVRGLDTPQRVYAVTPATPRA